MKIAGTTAQTTGSAAFDTFLAAACELKEARNHPAQLEKVQIKRAIAKTKRVSS